MAKETKKKGKSYNDCDIGEKAKPKGKDKGQKKGLTPQKARTR